MKNNLEFNGLDFKQFFILMSSLDYIYIYGKEENGRLNLEEFQKFFADGIIRADFLDNVDDCYIDQEETDEKLIITDHWKR